MTAGADALAVASAASAASAASCVASRVPYKKQIPQHLNTREMAELATVRPPSSAAAAFTKEAALLARIRSKARVACAPPPPAVADKAGVSHRTDWKSWCTVVPAGEMLLLLLLSTIGLIALSARSWRTTRPHTCRCVNAEAASVHRMREGAS